MSHVVRVTGISGLVFWLNQEGRTVTALKDAKRWPSKTQAELAEETYWDTIALPLKRHLKVDVILTEEAKE